MGFKESREEEQIFHAYGWDGYNLVFTYGAGRI